MKISDFQYYPNFVFLTKADDFCVSTTDVEMMKHVVNAESKKTVESFRIGDQICFEPEGKVYEVENIEIIGVTNDIDRFKYGIDLDNCALQGEVKQILFKIKIGVKEV